MKLDSCIESDHDKIIKLESQVGIKLTTLCNSVSKIEEKIDIGFQRNEEAHMQIIKDLDNKIEKRVLSKTFWTITAGLFILICGAYGYTCLIAAALAG